MGKRVCVVGAGPSGLTAVETLRQAGLEATGFEMSPVVGGHWVIDNPNGCSAAYRSLRTNTTEAMSRFSDFGMPPDWPACRPPPRAARERRARPILSRRAWSTAICGQELRSGRRDPPNKNPAGSRQRGFVCSP